MKWTQVNHKKLIFTLAKLSISVGLIAWLISSGRLNLDQLQVFGHHPGLLIFVGLFWILGTIGLGGARWYYLMKGVHLKPQYSRVLQLTAIGAFFNSLMPGAVGGDLIKAVYIFKDETKGNRNVAALTVLLDRVLGVLGMFTIAAIGVLIGAEFTFSQKELILPAAVAIGVPFLVIGAALPVVYRIGIVDRLIHRFSSTHIPGSGLVLKLYGALSRYRDDKIYLVWCLVFSLLIQGILLLYYWHLAELLSGRDIPIALVAAVLPTGILLSTVPLAPGGLGVGHVAFDRLFEIAEIGHGADIFNIVFIGQMVMNMFGVIPYLLFKSRLPSPADMMVQEDSAPSPAQQ